jgi:flagellar biosynthesis protein FlhF
MLKTLKVETPAEAYKIIKQEFGQDNVSIVSNKRVRQNPPLYEIVILVEEDSTKEPYSPPPVTREKPARQQSIKSPKNSTSLEDDGIMLNISDAVKEISQIADSVDFPAKGVGKKQNPLQKSSKEVKPLTKNQKNDVVGEEIGVIRSEITKLHDKVKLIQHMMWEEQAEIRGDLSLPPEFAQIYKLTRQSGMSKEHIDPIMKLTVEQMPNSMRKNSETVMRYFKTLLRKLIPTRNEPKFQKGVQKVLMLVGPTGVGKTTTLAKLAAKYSYINTTRHKVGIITLDRFRIGAVEQLYQYAKMMRLPIHDVDNTDEFNQALNSLSHCEVILIDTVGSSQYDNEKLSYIESYIKQSNYEIDVNLVLSATTKLDDLKSIYKNFSYLNIDTLIFTKLDETRGFGNIFSLVYSYKKPISYFSVGQDVPNDIITASSEFLINCIFDGFSKDRK